MSDPPATSTARTENPLHQKLNETFYASEPFNYLSQRLVALLAMKDHGEEVLKLLPEKMEIAGSSFGRIAPSDESADNQWRYTIAESEVLVHHVSETVLRLYLAHADRPPVPSVGLWKTRDFRKLRETVEELAKRLDSGQESETVHDLFHGSDQREGLGNPEPPTQERWDKAAANIAGFLSRFASIFLDSAPYNAAKHGLGIAAGASRLEVAVDGSQVIEGEGSTITFLDRSNDGTPGGLGLRTKWVSPEHSIALSVAGCHLMHQLWKVARWRYLGEDPQGLRLMDELSLADVDAGLPERRLTNFTLNFGLDEIQY